MLLPVQRLTGDPLSHVARGGGLTLLPAPAWPLGAGHPPADADGLGQGWSCGLSRAIRTIPGKGVSSSILGAR